MLSAGLYKPELKTLTICISYSIIRIITSVGYSSDLLCSMGRCWRYLDWYKCANKGKSKVKDIDVLQIARKNWKNLQYLVLGREDLN